MKTSKRLPWAAAIFLSPILLPLGTPFFSLPAGAAPPVPPAPTYYVFDEPHVLSPQMLAALQALLVEQDHATGQQLLVAIFKGLDGETLTARTDQVFQAWEIGSQSQGNGSLIALYWNEKQARLEVGYGLEDQLPDARAQTLVSNFLLPELRNGNPNRAFALTVYQTLTALESPLIINGLADRMLRTQGGFRGSWNETSAAPLPLKYGWIGWLILGLVLMTVVAYFVASAEAHFTRNGWFRPRPWHRGKRGSPALNANGGGADASW